MENVKSSETKLKNPNTLAVLLIFPEVEFQRLFPKVRIYIIGAVDLCGRANFPHKRDLKIGW